jgi:hypothetical protein
MTPNKVFSTVNIARLAIGFLFVLPIAGCTKKPPDNLLTAQDKAVISQAYAGNELKFSLRIIDSHLLSCQKVELTLDKSVSTTISDLPITSAKLEIKPQIQNDIMVLSFPTTVDFSPGIWHLSEIRFYQADKKSWISLKEGQDYDGNGFRLVNLSEQGKVGTKFEQAGFEAIHLPGNKQ